MNNQTIKLKIRAIYRNLSKKEKAIADFILIDPRRTSRMTINEIASELGFADSTIYQFSRKLGYKGFRDFQNNLMSEEYDPEISIHENIKKEDDKLTISKKVFDSSINSLKDTASLLNIDDLEKAAQYILDANILYFFGIGGSNIVSYDAYHKFLRSPIKCSFSIDYHIQLMQASLMNENDCAILISHSGLTKEVLTLAKTIKEHNAKLILLTSYDGTELAKLADVKFISVSEETGYRSESLSSRISQLAITDSLFTIVMFNNDDLSNESLKRVRKVIAETKE